MNIPSGLRPIPLAPVVFCFTTRHGYVNLRCTLAAKLPVNLDRSGQLTLGPTSPLRHGHQLVRMGEGGWVGDRCSLRW